MLNKRRKGAYSGTPASKRQGGRYSGPPALKASRSHLDFPLLELTTVLSLEVGEVVLSIDLTCLATTVKTLQVGLTVNNTLMRKGASRNTTFCCVHIKPGKMRYLWVWSSLQNLLRAT
eukprot:1208958-Amphidinium_carterae.1